MKGKGTLLIITIIVWVIAVGMIQSHNGGITVVGYVIALGCAYVFLKTVTSNDDKDK